MGKENSLSEIKIPFDKNYLEIEFVSFDYKNPKKNKFAYYLAGYDSNYRIIHNKNSAVYMNLPEGEYVFNVKGSNSSGIWNEKEASVNIFVIPPFYKAWWFITLSILFLSIVTLSILYMKVKSIISLERLRTNIAADLHDSIGTNLTEIIMLSDIILDNLENGKEINKKSVRHITESSRSVMGNMSDIVWLIKSNENSTLKDLFTRISENFNTLFTISEIDFEITNYEQSSKIKLTIEKKRHIYLVLKEFINNSVKHSECTNIFLEVNNVVNNFELIIRDNGKGFNLNNIDEGNGLGNIRKRVKKNNAKQTLMSKEGHGTELTIIFS